jgi:hypothetical protein
MKWPWKRKSRDLDGLADAKQRLAKARADEVYVDHLATNLHRKIRENHFGPRIAAALREGPR